MNWPKDFPSLTRSQIERLIDFAQRQRVAQALEADRELTRAWARASEPAFEAVWSNPEDEVYDSL